MTRDEALTRARRAVDAYVTQSDWRLPSPVRTIDQYVADEIEKLWREWSETHAQQEVRL